MPPKPNARKWIDVQTVIAAITIVATLGLWDLFSIPAKAEAAQAQEPVVVPPSGPSPSAQPTVMPKVKIMFTQTAPQNPILQQLQIVKRKKKNNNNGGGGGGSVTQTRSS